MGNSIFQQRLFDESYVALQTTLSDLNVLTQRNMVLTAAHSLGLSVIVASSILLLSVPTAWPWRWRTPERICALRSCRSRAAVPHPGRCQLS